MRNCILAWLLSLLMLGGLARVIPCEAAQAEAEYDQLRHDRIHAHRRTL